ncbi:mannitol-1-phosphate 5-dehydrogenase [Enterococcus sp. 669A]|uniref:Mannitol-1-phosphate 5-dehydrogenase n=1 Tax=Candidatus Enterococcus moelleringii TaxID=2815325 RepID=A0ABS3L7P1_9ENTE|nr:mannitol-1-phosphate 5-dehydrogenase [Enterococcus sp. 669A]MBO1305631.1 mannitol-1-phosphate 5-dehydrogenase [Enterococcus sp. 669A]
MKAVHFGAGNIGRGFIGQVLHNNGFELCYVDTAQPVIDQLNQDHGYPIEFLEEQQSTVFIDHVRALHSLNQTDQVLPEIQTADLLTTSVGANNLVRIAPTIAKALTTRFTEKQAPINILANENIINASSLLKEHVYQELTESQRQLFDQYASFVDTAIDRQALAKEIAGKSVAVVEPYYEWVISQSQWNPETGVNLQGVTFVEDMQPFIERKLYIVNAAHAAFAYLGSLFDYETVQEAMQDLTLVKIVHGFLTENKAYFQQKYQSSEAELDTFIAKTLKRHGNPMLADSVHRVGRSPIRKLNSQDRLVAPVKALAEMNLPYQNGLKVIVAAYLYKNADDEEALELQQLIEEKGPLAAFSQISEIEGELAVKLNPLYNKVKEDKHYLIEGEEHA